jgi:Na+/phosphate symporter
MKPEIPNPRTVKQYINRSRALTFMVLVQLIASTAFAITQQSSALGLALLVGLTFTWGGLLGSGVGVATILLLNVATSAIAVIYSVKALRLSKTNLDMTGKRSARFALAFASLAFTWLALQAAMTVLVVWAISSVWG